MDIFSQMGRMWAIGNVSIKTNAWEVEVLGDKRKWLTKDVEDKRPAQRLWD